MPGWFSGSTYPEILIFCVSWKALEANESSEYFVLDLSYIKLYRKTISCLRPEDCLKKIVKGPGLPSCGLRPHLGRPGRGERPLSMAEGTPSRVFYYNNLTAHPCHPTEYKMVRPVLSIRKAKHSEYVLNHCTQAWIQTILPRNCLQLVCMLTRPNYSFTVHSLTKTLKTHKVQ